MGSSTLAANGFLLLVNFNPSDAALLAAFRSRFNVSPTVPIYGPYQGKLDNSSGDVRLSLPDVPLAGETPYIMVDEVDYADSAPWTSAADGSGASLQRIAGTQYGNDPTNWFAGTPGAGYSFTFGTAPSITVQPVGQSGLGSAPATFTVSANGTAPLRYQWRFNGTNISGATNASFTRGYVRPEDSGLYRVTVFNGAGSVESSNALLNVVLGPFFALNPTNFPTRIGSNVIFTAAALGNPPVTYQWRLNGTNAPGVVTSTSSNTTLTITNVQTAQAGLYTALATDNVGTVPSTAALLTLLVDPAITQQPLGQGVVAGASVTLSVSVTNTATLPVGYRWRRNGASIPNAFFILNQTTAFYVVTNVLSAANYSVVVTNAGRPAGFTSVNASVAILPDTDGDGIPDAWETLYGLLPGSAADRDLDADGDGMSNWAEYIAGTNPTNNLSYLKVDATVLGGGATVSFGAISNRTYTVQFTDAVGGGSWNNLADVLARSTNRVETISDPLFTTSRYYRITTPQQP